MPIYKLKYINTVLFGSLVNLKFCYCSGVLLSGLQHTCSQPQSQAKDSDVGFTDPAIFLNSLRSDTKNVETPVRQSLMIEPERLLTGNTETLNKVWFLVAGQLLKF